MAITLVQSRSSTGNTSIALAYSSAVTPGNTLIACLGASNNTRTITAFSDNQFGNWVPAASSTTRALGAIYYLPTAVSSSVTPTVTATLSGASAMALTITEWSGLAQIVDQTGSSNGFGTTSLTTSTSSATTNATELTIANFATTTALTFTVGSGYTLIASNTNQGVEYAVTSSTGTQTATMTSSANATYDGEIATFFPVITTAPIMTRRYVHYYI